MNIKLDSLSLSTLNGVEYISEELFLGCSGANGRNGRFQTPVFPFVYLYPPRFAEKN